MGGTWGWALFWALVPWPVLACALPPSIILTLPTGWYLTGAAATVALTGLVAGLGPWLSRADWGGHRVMRLPAVPAGLSQGISFAATLGLLGLGLWGPRDPMHNLWTLIFWTGIWVALPLASMVFGNLWRAINPWRVPVRVIRLAIGARGGIGLGRLGAWPAVVGFAAFSWFQIVSLSPEDPAVLATWGGIYYLIILTLGVAEGEAWLEEGEFLSLYFAYLSKIAPLWREGDGLHLGWPGAQILRMAPLTPAQVVFVGGVLASLSFDGLRETFWWFGLTGQNPLEFAGRSAVVWPNSLGLIAAWILVLGSIMGALALGARKGGALPVGPIMLSFLAIAAGYHAAHYLMMLLTAGQYTLAALNDPFLRGDSWLGLPPFWISMGFLTDRSIMILIWNLQFIAILGAHMLAVLLALQVSQNHGVRGSHGPLTLLMVGYTVFGLWLLASPTGM